MEKSQTWKNLIEEPFPLRKERKGGAANLILTALLLEASRMVDENFDVPSVESAAKSVFGLSKGYLSIMDEIGIPEAVEAMESLSSKHEDTQDFFFSIYYNFFDPPSKALDMAAKVRKGEDESSVRWVSKADMQKKPNDLMSLELLKNRFQAVAFMTAVEIIDAEILKLEEVEKLCTTALGWKDGPFAMMNRIGIQEAMRIVVERMQISHRKEINFPVPRLLIAQAQKNELWAFIM